MSDLSGSVLIADYNRLNVIPTIDALLDWRNRLVELKGEKEYPECWYDREIAATDYLLSIAKQKP